MIDSFISDINKRGIARTSLFEVLITRAKDGDRHIEKDISMRIDSTDFPGRSLTLTESNYTGLPYHIVSGATMSDIPLTIILSEKFTEKDYIEKWQDAAVGSYRTEEIRGNSFNLGYYKDYVGTVDITQKNDLGKAVYRVKLIDAFPSSIGALSSTWSDSGEIHKLPVTFSYRYYKKEDIKN